jgi:nuclear control of ATPase protein 2
VLILPPAFPSRLLYLTRTILQTLRNRNIPLSPSIFTPSSLRQLFPSSNVLRPNALIAALFSHLQTHPHTTSLTFDSSRQRLHRTSKGAAHTFIIWTQSLFTIFTLPYDLTRHECQVKRRELEKIRDERAEVLGTLTDMRDQLANALKEEQPGFQINGVEVDDKLALFVDTLRRSTAGEVASPISTPSPPSLVSTHQDILGNIQSLANDTLQSHRIQHKNYLQSQNLNRPSRLTLIWPRILLLPPMSVYLLRAAYRSRTSLAEMAYGAVETLEGFFKDWLLEPVKGIIKTIRAGGEEGVIITKQGVAADMDVSSRYIYSIISSLLMFGSF